MIESDRKILRADILAARGRARRLDENDVLRKDLKAVKKYDFDSERDTLKVEIKCDTSEFDEYLRNISKHHDDLQSFYDSVLGKPYKS